VPYLTRGDGVKIYWEEAGRPEGLHYESAGAAGESAGAADRRPPLLLIMGLGATLEWWQRLIPILAPRYRTIVYDNRGVGRSDVPPGPYPIPAMADDAAAVMDAAGLASAHVFGASMGGMIAQELALNHPSRVRSLILGCTACGGRQSVPASKEVAAALGARSTMTREEAIWVMAPYIFDAGTPRERVAEDIAVRLAATVTNGGYFAQLQGIRAWGGTYDRLAGIAMPTLVIHGETDQLVPAENGRIIARAIPQARLVMIPHASHIFFTDQLEASSEALLAFLEAPTSV
jgi:pimeloyl-ACP methyl ester carboxylesterase